MSPIDVRMDRDLLTDALRRERQDLAVNAVDEDHQRGHDLVQYPGERAQVRTGVHNEGVCKRRSYRQQLP
jgi:hypothetical protein